jgi:hypothetical protein
LVCDQFIELWLAQSLIYILIADLIMNSQDCVLGAEMDATLNLLADNNDAPYGLATSPIPSSSAQSSQSSAASSGRMDKFLLLEALLSFLHSAVSSICIIGFHMHVSLYIHYIGQEE